MSWLKLEDYAKANIYLESFVSLFPLDPRKFKVSYILAEILFFNAQYLACIESCNRLIKIYQNKKDITSFSVLKARSFLAIGDESRAVHLLNAVINSNKKGKAIVVLASYYFEQERYNTVINLLSKYQNKSNDDLSSLKKKERDNLDYLLAKSFFFEGKYQQANKLFEILIGTDDGYIDEIEFLKALSWYRQGLYKQSINELKSFIARTNDPALKDQARYFLARNYEKISQTILAIDIYTHLTNDLQNEYADDSLYRIAVLSENEQGQINLPSLELLTNSTNKSYSDYAFKKLMTFYSARDIDKVLSLFNHLNKKTLDREEDKQSKKSSFLFLINLLEENNYYAKVIELTKSNQNLIRDDDLSYEKILADNYLNLDALDRALKYYNLLSKSANPDHVYQAKLNLGYIYYSQSKYSRAIAEYRKIENELVENNYPEGLFIIGDCYKNLGNKIKALDYFKKYQSSGDKKYLGETLLNIGKMNYQDKKYQKAIVAFKSGLKDQKIDLETKSKLKYWESWSYYRLDNKELAAKNFNQIFELAINKYAIEGKLSAGKIYYKLGKYKDSVDCFTELITYQEKITDKKYLPEAYYELVMSFIHLRDLAQAAFILEQFSKEFPDDIDFLPNAYLALAEKHLDLKQNKKAVILLKKINYREKKKLLLCSISFNEFISTRAEYRKIFRNFSIINDRK